MSFLALLSALVLMTAAVALQQVENLSRFNTNRPNLLAATALVFLVLWVALI